MPLTRFLSISEVSSIVSPSTGYRGFDVQQSKVGPTDRMGFLSHLLYQPSLELSEQLASVSLLGPWPWLQHQQHGRPSRINPPLLLQPLDPATPLKCTASHTASPGRQRGTLGSPSIQGWLPSVGHPSQARGSVFSAPQPPMKAIKVK